MNHATACFPQTPVRVFASESPQTEEPELLYLERLQSQLTTIAISIQKEKEDHARSMSQKEEGYASRIQEQEAMIESLLRRNEELQSQNNSLKMSTSQSMRYLKRYQMKLQLLSNKITHLMKAISEKEAIIRYLEEKSDQNNRLAQKLSSNDSIVHFQDIATYRKNEISFGKLKVSNPLTFESFTQINRNTPKAPTFPGEGRPRAQRIRTQTNDSKENRPKENIKNSSHQKLQDFLTANHRSYEQTLSKNRNLSTSSFWKQASFKGGQGPTLNKSINVDGTTFFRDILFERDSYIDQSYAKS